MTDMPQPSMHDGHLLSLIAQLDQHISRDNAHIKLQYWHPNSYLCIGNRAGYLRFGIELLKLAYVPVTATDMTFMGTEYSPTRPHDDESLLEVTAEFDDLFTDDSWLQLHWFQRTEVLPQQQKRVASPRWTWTSVGFFCILSIVGVFACIGLAIVVRYVILSP